MNTEDVAQRIKTACEAKGVSLYKAGIDSGAGRNLYSNLCRGSEPSVSKLKQIADYLGVSVDYLLSGEESKQIISNSNIVGEISGTAAIGEGNSITIAPTSDMSEDEKELLRIFKKLDRRGQNDLMHLAYQAEDAFESKK